MGLPLYTPAGRIAGPRVSRVKILQTDADGGVQAEGIDGDLDQLEGTDYVEPPGIALGSCADLEGVRLRGDPDPAIFPRGSRPSGLPSADAGGCVLYGPNGEYIQPTGGALILEPTGGNSILLGKNAITKVAVNGDDVPPNAAMNTWAAAVEAALAAGGPINPAQTWALTVTSAGSLGDVSASTSKVKAE